MKEIQSNINIIGGGLIGAVTAYSLSKLGNKVVVLEQNAKFNHKNILDKRTTAISEGTKKFLEEINIWNEIGNYAEPIKNIQIIDRNQSNKIYFDNQRRKSNLGYIVKNEFILDCLYKKLQKQKNVEIFNNVSVKDIFYQGDRIITKQNNFYVNTNILFACDGKNSSIRKIFKTPIYRKDYKKKAIVINFYHSKNHNNTAYEFFFKNGPLAILPMQKNKNQFQSSIVWTNTNKFINSLLSLDDNNIISILNEKTQGSVGEIKKIITKQTFAFSPEVFMSVRAIPKHILQRIIGDILERIKPRATRKQKGMVDQLSLLINQPHFSDLYDNWEEGLKDGKEFINHMEARRNNPTTMHDIMHRDKELGEWYDSI